MTTIPIPGWYNQAQDNVATSQSEIFLLHGDTLGYPVMPGQGLVPFLKSAAASVNPEGLFVVVSPASGLTMDARHDKVFNTFSPPPKGAFPAGGIGPSLSRLHAYFRCEDPECPPMTLVVMDSDLLFDSDSPMMEPEKLMISYVRQWASRPLLNRKGDAHRIFMISQSNMGIRKALLQGRVAEVKIPMPDESARKRFIDEVIAKVESTITMEDDLDAAGLARITGALNLLQIEDVIYQAILRDGKLTRKMVNDRKDELIRTAYGGVVQISYPDPKVSGFDSIIGYEHIKEYMRDFVLPLLLAGDSRCPKGCVFSGPPGTGKSMSGVALAASLALPLVTLCMNEIKNKYVGESQKNMAKLCEGILAMAPCIVFVDEIDKIMPSGDDSTGVSDEILGQFQTFVSDIPRGMGFFVGTTNYPRRIPRALLRPGRFEEVIPMLPQHLDGLRHKALPIIAKSMGQIVGDNVNFGLIAEQCPDYTGADLGNLLIKANKISVMAGCESIDQAHLEEAVQNIVPTVAETQTMLDEALRFCSDKSYVPDGLQNRVGKADTEEIDDGITTRRIPTR